MNPPPLTMNPPPLTMNSPQVRTGAGSRVNLLDNVRALQDAGAAILTVSNIIIRIIVLMIVIIIVIIIMIMIMINVLLLVESNSFTHLRVLSGTH
jgi:hypothetical protein